MVNTDYVLNPKTGRYVKKNSRIGKRLMKEGLVQTETSKQPKQQEEPEPEEPEREPAACISQYDEAKLQHTLADLSTDLIRNNLDKVVKAQSLSNAQMDTMLKRLLYEKLCLNEPEPPQKGGKKKKHRKKPTPKPKKKSKRKKPKYVIESSSDSESETQSDSD